MADVFDCANFFIEIAIHNEDFDMTNMKLNKLLYFAQGTHLSRTGKRLFNNTVQAWTHGPVIPRIYFKYNSYESSPISKVDDNYSFNLFLSEERTTLLDVMRELGKYTASTLRNITHMPGSPWSIAFSEKEKRQIPVDVLRKYFTEHPVKKFRLSGKIPITRALPKDWYDPMEDSVWESYLK
ncbi:MAG: Panacea domain-containing protein [Sphaerochaeta sp.]